MIIRKVVSEDELSRGDGIICNEQLDGDLDEQETEILMTHTRHCPDCAAMFSRLQMLSSGLENLPKVTPSYSLVDAIMPRLQELQTAALPLRSVCPQVKKNKPRQSIDGSQEIEQPVGGRIASRFVLLEAS